MNNDLLNFIMDDKPKGKVMDTVTHQPVLILNRKTIKSDQMLVTLANTKGC